MSGSRIHPDFDPHSVVGKRDDELVSADNAAEIMMLKRQVIASGMPTTRVLDFRRSDGPHRYNISAVPLMEDSGKVHGVITAAVEIPIREPSG